VTAAQGAASVFLYKALLDEEIEIWGDGSVIRDYMYVGDAVTAMIKAIDYDGDVRTFNIGSGQGHSLLDLINEIEKLLGRPVKHRHTAARRLDVPVNILNIERAKNLLQWQPSLTLRQGIERTVAWIKTGNPEF
jgi:UDP-glucose 4-epimerase